MADATNQMPAELAEIIALHREMFEGYSMNAEDINQSQALQAPQAPQNTNAEPSTDGDGFAPITSQEALNKVISERLARERSKFSDYDQLKAQAEEFRKAQDANKTAEERMAERLASLEQELNGSKLEALRSRVQARFKLADEDAELFLTGNDEETLTAQAERLAARLADAQPKKSNSVPREGRSAGPAASDPMRALARAVFSQTD